MKKSNYKKITAVLLVLLLVLGICPGTAFAEPAQTSHPSGSLEPTETAQPIQADDEATLMEETVSAEAFSPLIPIDEEPAAGINATAATASTAGATIADGIYAFKNITNTGRWMDTQYDSTQAGYHMQQYAYNPSPATSSALYALFKVTHAGSGRYIIRLMLNNELSFGVSGSDILTKTIAVDDSDVPTSDMFYINYDSASGGYTIEPCANPGYLVAARQTTASGSAGAPNSYLLAVPKSSSSSYSATWQPHVYTGPIDFGDVYPHYIPDGVYAFANVNNDGLWMDTQQDKILPGYHIQQYAYPTNPTEAFERGGLFKIKRDGTSNRYIIRSMLNNRMTMTTAGTYGTDIITEELTAYDNDVSTADMFYINYDATIGTYTVEPCSDPGYVIAARQTTASGASGEPNSFLTLVSKSSTSYSPDWFLHRYMGPDQSGGMANYNNPFIAGSTGRVTAYAWSTIVGANVQYMYIGNDQANIATGTWSENDYKLYVSPHDEGDFRVFMDIYKNTEIQHRFALDLRVELPVEEGSYFFQNKELSSLFMQIDNDETGSDAKMELWPPNFERRDDELIKDQQWELTHITDSYYKIKSAKSNNYLSIQEGEENHDEKSVIQTDEAENDRQIWSFTKNSDGSFVIRPKSGEAYDTDWCIAAGDGLGTNGRNVEQRNYVAGSAKHEWFINKIGSQVMLVGIEASDRDRLSWMFNVMPALGKTKFDEFNIFYTDFMEVEDCIESMKTCEFFIIRTHGSINSDVYLDGGLSRLTAYDINGKNFDNIEVMLYVACYSARDTDNVVMASVGAGAKYAIGFQSTIHVEGANTWTELFCQYYAAGDDVVDAAKKARDETARIHSNLEDKNELGIKSMLVVTQ